MNIVVIGSTLPYHYLLTNKLNNIDYFIFLNKKLLNTFKSLNNNLYQAKLLSFDLNSDLSKKIVLKSKNIICFHECCYSQIDSLIVKYKLKVKFYPISNLSSLIKLDYNFPLEVFRLFKLNEIIIHFLKFFLEKMVFWNKYNWYLMPTDFDAKTDFVLVKSLNYLKPNILVNNQLQRFKYKKKPKSNKSKTVFILISEDVVCNKIQLEIYSKIYQILKKNFFRVLIKVHPKYDIDLTLKYFDKEDVFTKSNYPFEVLKIDYKYKISLLSTSLFYEPEKSISIQNLIETNSDLKVNYKFNLRKKHLKNLNNQINFPDNLDDLTNLIIND